MNKKIENARNLYLEGIRDGNYEEAVNKYTGHKYIQHSTGVKDGKEGFIEFFSDFVKRIPKREIEIVRAIVEGQYVFLQAFQSLNDGEYKYVTTDFFDTDKEDKIIEHWDVIAEFSDTNPSGNTTIDGVAEVKDLDKTEENKALVRKVLSDAFMEGGNPANLSNYISKNQYTEHSKGIADYLVPLNEIASKASCPLNYKRIALIVGQGNFVATLSEANMKTEQNNQDYAYVDIFRIENGKVVEHWDNVEPVPENDVNGGKF